MSKNVMRYNGYTAVISYDADDRIFVGEVTGTSDSLSFHGNTPDELEESFKNCINNYLKFCAQVGKKPQNHTQALFNVRVTPELHAEASGIYARNNISLNQVVLQALQMFVNAEPERKIKK